MTDLATSGHTPHVILAVHSGANVVMDAKTPIPERLGHVDIPQFRKIYDDFFDFVYRAARRLGVHERSLDDATQDVFLVVHRRLTDFEGRSSLKTWLYGITRRVAKDYRRRSSRKEQGMVSTDGLQAVTKGPEQEVAGRQAAKILGEILETLPSDRREIFVLAEMEQMTVPEIANALSINLNTTYSRLRVARTEFEKAVARHLAKTEKNA